MVADERRTDKTICLAAPPLSKVTEGRIEGVERLSHQWVIPVNAEKPKDARIKSGKYIKTKSGNGESEDGKKTV